MQRGHLVSLNARNNGTDVYKRQGSEVKTVDPTETKRIESAALVRIPASDNITGLEVLVVPEV